MTLKAEKSMIFDKCSDIELDSSFKENYSEKYRWECRICGQEDKISFHMVEDSETLSLAMAMCEECHEKFCNDLKTDEVATCENTLVEKIQEYAKVSDSIYISKIHGNNFQENGLPDFIGHIKGSYIGIETKKYDNNPSMIQKYQINQIQETGGLAYACYSIEQFYTIVNTIREDNNNG